MSDTGVINLGPNNRSAEAGLFPTKSAAVTLGKPFGFTAKFISSDTAGGVLVVGKDGTNQWIPYVGQNAWVPFWFTQVLASGTDWQGNSRTSVTASFTAFGCE